MGTLRTMRPAIRPTRRRPLRIFVSHRFRHSDHLDALIRLLAPEWVRDVDYILMCPTVDDPLHPHHDAALEAELDRLIAISDLFWALAGVYASHGYYMGFESDAALRHGVAQLAITPHHQERLSTVATADGERRTVAWRLDSIVEESLAELPPSLRMEFLRESLERDIEDLDGTRAVEPAPRLGQGSNAGALYDSTPDRDFWPAARELVAKADSGVLGALRRARTRSGVLGALDVDLSATWGLCAADVDWPLDFPNSEDTYAVPRRLGEVRTIDALGDVDPLGTIAPLPDRRRGALEDYLDHLTDDGFAHHARRLGSR